MYATTVRVKNPADVIFRLPKEFNKRVIKSREKHGEKDLRMRAHQEAQGGHVILASGSRWGGDRVLTVIVWCEEHQCAELVPAPNYWDDLAFWYQNKRHPRFSIVGVLVKAGQRWSEIPTSWRDRSAVFDKAVAACTSEADFLKRMKPYLFTNLYLRGRRLRVSNAFKEKFLKREFTVDDFINEQNQEIRRVMARVLPIRKITHRMRRIKWDQEGVLYERDNRHYLYVVCPSTKQEYLLEVPRADNDGTPLDTPAKARRWTFNLPADAAFLKEA